MKAFKLLTAITVLLGLGCTEIALAHEQAGAVGRKNSKAGGTDMYTVSCFDDGNGVPEHLFVDVVDARPRNPAKISAQVMLPSTGAISEMTTDPGDGDAFPSPGLELAGGVGPYQIDVTKSKSGKKGVELYIVNFHCETAIGVHTGTTETELMQNQ